MNGVWERRRAKHDRLTADPTATAAQRAQASRDLAEATEAQKKVYEDYRQLPHEADAFKTEDAIEACW